MLILKEKNYIDLDVLVAFSSSVTGDGNESTEQSMNIAKDGERIKENQFKAIFHGEDFNLLIVAVKYQTGFDEPLLHTMFVDKKLCFVKAVQTLRKERYVYLRFCEHSRRYFRSISNFL